MGMSVPFYNELPRRGVAQQRVGWDLFGERYPLGRLNLVDSQVVQQELIGVGDPTPISLNWNLEYPDPGILGRTPYKHNIKRVTDGWDDYLDGYFPQGSSQWDAMCHCRHPELGYYNGVLATDEFDGDLSVREKLGIHNLARAGITARFILIDIVNFHAQSGVSWSGMSGFQISKELLISILDFQETTLQSGDILILRTGWTEEYSNFSPSARVQLAAAPLKISGLKNDESLIEWLWDQGVVGIAADNPTVEATPFDVSDPATFMHYQLIPLLGFLLGELFDLEALAKRCAESSKWHGVIISAPLNIYAGVGSPANSIALV
jgi:kynurenine formamidase